MIVTVFCLIGYDVSNLSRDLLYNKGFKWWTFDNTTVSHFWGGVDGTQDACSKGILHRFSTDRIWIRQDRLLQTCKPWPVHTAKWNRLLSTFLLRSVQFSDANSNFTSRKGHQTDGSFLITLNKFWKVWFGGAGNGTGIICQLSGSMIKDESVFPFLNR